MAVTRNCPLADEVPHLGRSLAEAQEKHGHLGVSVSGSKEEPSISVVWKSPRKCPVSCAAMYATVSAPQLARLTEGPHIPEKRFASETAAPLCTVPLRVAGPGIDPSTPTTVPPLPLLEPCRMLCTRKRLMVLAVLSLESVSIWSSASQGPVASALTLVPKRAFAAADTSWKLGVPTVMPAAA